MRHVWNLFLLGRGELFAVLLRLLETRLRAPPSTSTQNDVNEVSKVFSFLKFFYCKFYYGRGEELMMIFSWKSHPEHGYASAGLSDMFLLSKVAIVGMENVLSDGSITCWGRHRSAKGWIQLFMTAMERKTELWMVKQAIHTQRAVVKDRHTY